MSACLSACLSVSHRVASNLTRPCSPGQSSCGCSCGWRTDSLPFPFAAPGLPLPYRIALFASNSSASKTKHGRPPVCQTGQRRRKIGCTTQRTAYTMSLSQRALEGDRRRTVLAFAGLLLCGERVHESRRSRGCEVPPRRALDCGGCVRLGAQALPRLSPAYRSL